MKGMIAEKIVFSVQIFRLKTGGLFRCSEGGKQQAKKSQHPCWLNNTWKQCEQCRAFPLVREAQVGNA